MKKFNYVILAATALTVLSCSNDESTISQEINEVTAQQGVELLVSMENNETYGTRAIEANIPTFDYTTAGIFAYQTGETTSVDGYAGYKNLVVSAAVDYTIDTETYKKLTPSKDATDISILFPLSGDNVDVYVYAPHSASYDAADVTAMTFSVQDDQTAPANYLASDFVYGKATATTTDKRAAVTMYHALTKLTFKIDDATNGTNASGITKIELKDVFKKATINMSKAANATAPWLTAWDATPANNHVVTSTSNDDIGNVIVYETDNTTYTSEALYAAVKPEGTGGVSAIIPAQTGLSASAGGKISVTIDDQTREAYLGSADLSSLLPGYEYVYTLNIKSQELVVAVSIKPWVTVEETRDLEF